MDKFKLPPGMKMPKTAAEFMAFLEEHGKQAPRTLEVMSAIFHRKGGDDEAMNYASKASGFAHLLSLAAVQMANCDGGKSCPIHSPWRAVGEMGAALAKLCAIDQTDVESLCRARFEDQ
jgi:hypothetical protein